MACTYTYKGQQYTLEELREQWLKDNYKEEDLYAPVQVPVDISQNAIKKELGVNYGKEISGQQLANLKSLIKKRNIKNVANNINIRYEILEKQKGESDGYTYTLFKYNKSVNIDRTINKLEEASFNHKSDLLQDAIVAREKANKTSFGQLDLFDTLGFPTPVGNKTVPKQDQPKRSMEADATLKFMEHKQFMKRKLETDRLKFPIKSEEYQRITTRIEKLESEIEGYKKDLSLDVIKKAAFDDLLYTEALLNQASVNGKSLDEAISAINRVLRELELWRNPDMIRDMLNNDVSPDPLYTTTTQAAVDQIEGKASELYVRAIEKAKNLMTSEANVALDRELTQEELFGATEDISFVASQFLDISTSGKAVTDLLDNWKRIADFRTREELTDIVSGISDVFGKLGKDKQKLLLQEDTNGLTGNLVHYISPKYYQEREKLIPDDKLRKDKNAWKPYLQWVAKNSLTIDPRILFYEEYNKLGIGKQYTEADRTKLIAEIKAHSGSAMYEAVYKRAEKRHIQYLQQKEGMMEHAADQAEQQGITEEEYIKNWEAAHSPYYYMENIERGVSNVKAINGEHIRSRGGNYILTIPRRTVNGKETDFYDKKFETIQNDPELKKAYDTALDVMHSLKQYLPRNVQANMKVNSLPTVKKDWMEKMAGRNLKDMVRMIGKDFTDSLVDDEDIYISGQINPVTGKIERSLSTPFIGRDIPIDMRSFDLEKILQLYAAMAVGYKNKAQVEHKLTLMEELIFSMKELHEASQDPTKSRKTTGELSRLREQVSYAVDTFFGMTKDKTLSKTKKLTKEERLEKQRLMEKQLSLIQQKDNGKITEEEFNSEYNKAQSDIAKLGKKYSLTRMGDHLLTFNQLRGMGWNISGAIGNVTVGQLSNVIHASRKEDFDMQEYSKAFAIVHNPKHITNDKLNMLMKKFNVLKRYTEEAAVKDHNSNERKKGAERLLPYEVYRLTEYKIQGTAFVAMMLHTKVADKNGKMVSLWEAYDEAGNWDTKKMGENNEWNGKSGEGASMKRFKFENKVTAVLKRLHGNYDHLSSVRIKKIFWGRAFMQFRSWLPMAIENRFGNVRYDQNLERDVKGRYRSYADYMNSKGGIMPGILGIVTELGRKALWQNTTFKASGEFTEVDAANMRANLTELMAFLVMLGASIALKAAFGDDDDDEYEKSVYYYWMNQIQRLMNDTTFYVDPSSGERISKNIIPLMSLIPSTIKAVDSTVGLVMGDDEYINGRYSGESKALHAWSELVPFGNQVMNVYKSSQQVFE